MNVLRSRSRMIVVLLAVVLTTITRPAWCDNNDDTAAAAADAKAIKERGDDALVAGRHAEALALYEEAYAKHPDPALLYNEGRALESLGDFSAALDKLEEFDRTAPPALRARVPLLDKLLGELRLKTSSLVMTCNLEGARVRIDGRAVGVTPLLQPKRVRVGDAISVEVELEGYLPWKHTLSFKGGVATIVDVRLAKRATEGIVVVRSPIAGAHVAIDGKAEGTTPSELVVHEGTHRIDLTREGYQPASKTIVVGAGNRHEIDLGLDREASLLTRWWFWTAAAAVATGTVITIYAVTKERDPDAGNIAPGRISAGLHF